MNFLAIMLSVGVFLAGCVQNPSVSNTKPPAVSHKDMPVKQKPVPLSPEQKQIIADYLKKNPNGPPGTKPIVQQPPAGTTLAPEAVLKIESSSGSFGSGAFITDDGLIVTAAHVGELFTKEPMRITTSEGKTFTARVLNIHRGCDMAVAKIYQKANVPYLTIAKGKLMPGEAATLWGFSGGQLAAKHLVFKQYNATLAQNGVDDLLFGPGVRPGDSGGAILNAAGEQVGIAVAVINMDTPALNMKTGDTLGVSIGHCVDIMLSNGGTP